jgi:hypothetical protein
LSRGERNNSSKLKPLNCANVENVVKPTKIRDAEDH